MYIVKFKEVQAGKTKTKKLVNDDCLFVDGYLMLFLILFTLGKILKTQDEHDDEDIYPNHQFERTQCVTKTNEQQKSMSLTNNERLFLGIWEQVVCCM